MMLIARDYLHSLPNVNNKTCESSSSDWIKTIEKNYLNLIKEHNFEGDSIKGLSINII